MWSEFGASSFVIPRFELVKNQEGTNFACNLIPEYDFDNIDNILHQLEKLNPDIEQDITPLPQLLNRMDNPDQTEWRTKILQALEYLQIGDLQKIVLARKTELRFDDKLDPVSLLQHLEAPGCFRFLWEPQPGRAFVSIPPERLYKREERRISCEALAGTRPRGHTVDEDNRLGQELLNSDKERREHLFVADTIRKVLSMLCQKIGEGDAVTIMKLRELQHLMTSFDCELRETVSDSDVLANLHPTPAVAGYPVDEARNRIASMEPFDRGWYAGPVGWVNNEGAEFAVAIRSGLVYDNKLYLYSGAGIVDGSDWQLEWEEIENKITQFLRLFT
ncbi:MAG: isochorismate synthase [candidate division Zixibacteria bacterium]|nr:isochorismate synthase [candidate division Zixibacteria bacterium]